MSHCLQALTVTTAADHLHIVKLFFRTFTLTHWATQSVSLTTASPTLELNAFAPCAHPDGAFQVLSYRA